MRRDLISKKKRKNMQNCGIIVDWQMTRQRKKIATCLCSIAHLPAHTTKGRITTNASRLPRSALSAVDLN